MQLNELLSMSVSDRTDYLERLLAAPYELETAPGIKTESDLLESLLGKLSKYPGMDGDTLTKSLWARYFKAPLLLLKMLQVFHPRLLETGKQLRVLYLGAGHDEFPDQGRWHALVWLMATGRPITDLKIVAVGPALSTSHTWEASPVVWSDMVAHLPPFVGFLPGTLQEAMSTNGMAVDWEDHFDVVVMHHPGFVANFLSWSQDEAWADLAGFAKIPVIGTSFDPVDLAFDRKGLAVCGRIIDRVYWNSSAHVAPFDNFDTHLGTRIQWGGVMWSTVLDDQTGENMISNSQQQAINWQEEMHIPLIMNRTTDLHQYLRWLYTCPMQFDDIHEHLYLSDDIRIRRNDACIEAFGQIRPATDLSRRLIETTILEDRLRLVPKLSEELSTQLDMQAVASVYVNNVQRDNNRRQGKADLVEGLVSLLWSDPETGDDIEVRHVASHGAIFRSEPEYLSAAMAYFEVSHEPMQLDGRGTCTKAAVASLIYPCTSGLARGDTYLVEAAIDLDGPLGHSPERVARFIAVIVTAEGIIHHKDEELPASEIKTILEKVFTEEGLLTFSARKVWGTNPYSPDNVTIVSIESVWIHPNHRTEAMVEHVIHTACGLAEFFSDIDGLIYPMISAQELTQDGRSIAMEPELQNWLQGALVNLGASIPRPRATAIGNSPTIERVLLPTPDYFLP